MVLFHDDPARPYLFLLFGAYLVLRYTIDERGKVADDMLDLSPLVAQDERRPEVYYMSVYEELLAVSFLSGHVSIIDVRFEDYDDGGCEGALLPIGPPFE
jgi:hypothetical protein